MKKVLIIAMLAIILIPGVAFAQNSVWDDIIAQLQQILARIDVLIAERDAALEVVEEEVSEPEEEVVYNRDFEVNLGSSFIIRPGDKISIKNVEGGLYFTNIRPDSSCVSVPCQYEAFIDVHGDNISGSLQQGLDLNSKAPLEGFDGYFIKMTSWSGQFSNARILITDR